MPLEPPDPQGDGTAGLSRNDAPQIVRPYPLAPLPEGRFYVEPEDPRLLSPSGAFVLEDADPFDHYHYRIKSLICSRRTAFQDVVVADTHSYGVALFMDGAIQSSRDDEALYHEMLVQPAMLLHDRPRDVLIIGGGEGASLREVLAHASVTRAVMVDIDRDAVEICREHLPAWHCGAFDDARSQLHFEDGRAFVEQCDDFFDVIIIDVVDMLDNGPAQRLYTRQFYELLRRRLRKGGILVVQALEFSFNDYKGHSALRRTLKTVFGEVHSYQAAIPSFLSIWGFIIASDHLDPAMPTAATIDRRIDERLGAAWLDHLTGDFFRASLCFCKDTHFHLGLPGPILEDDVVFVPPPDVQEVETRHAQFPALGT